MRESETSLLKQLLVMRIIAAALLASSVFTMVLMVVLAQSRGGPRGSPEAIPVVTWIAVGVLAAQVAASLVFPRLVEQSGVARLAGVPREQYDPARETGSLLEIYQARMVVTMALFEGAGILASIAFLVETQPMALVANLAAIVALGLNFPTGGRVTEWLAEKRRQVTELRSRLATRPKG